VTCTASTVMRSLPDQRDSPPSIARVTCPITNPWSRRRIGRP
jgi:hypothetical protein